MAPTPNQFVRSSLDRVTLSFTTGYWTHEIQVREGETLCVKGKTHLNDILGLDSFSLTRILVEQSDNVCSRWCSRQSVEEADQTTIGQLRFSLPSFFAYLSSLVIPFPLSFRCLSLK